MDYGLMWKQLARVIDLGIKKTPALTDNATLLQVKLTMERIEATEEHRVKR